MSQVLIVGAGPTGLALALRLAHHGVRARIIDRSAGPGQASRAMAMHARTLEFYGQMGLAEEIVAGGVRVEQVHLRGGGEEVARLTLKDMGAGVSPFPFMLAYPQDDHERFLVGKLAPMGVAVEWNTRLVGFTQHGEGVRATLARDGAEEVVEAAYLCGCDGGHSTVREGLGIPFEGGTYPHLYYVADVRLAGETDEDAHMNLGADAFALRLPVRSSGQHRLIGIVPDDVVAGRDLTFEDVRGHAEPLLGVTVAQTHWFSTYRVHHRVAERFAAGRCFLAGDAGHVHSPTGGQGMNTGIGDAVNLAWKLAQVLHGRAGPELLATYEAERLPFARALVATTDRAFEAVVATGVGGRVLRTWLLPHVLPVLARLSSVRRSMFRALSQVRIHYADSPLSEGRAGGVAGGDRLPWVPGGEADNFAPLRTMDWQVHVYGEPRPALAEAASRCGLPLHAFDWTETAQAAGLVRDAAYLVRPDGHVALVLADQDGDALAAYGPGRGLSFAPARPATDRA